MPAAQVQLLRQVWTQQIRHMQYMSQMTPQADVVRSSLPQGDTWAMLAMTAILLPAAYDLQQQLPGCLHVLYADDRSFACPTAAQAIQCQKAWDLWCQRLGLMENAHKSQFFHHNADGRRQLRNAGLPAGQVTDDMNVLGFSFQGVQKRKASAKERSRLETSVSKAVRCKCLPGSRARPHSLGQSNHPHPCGVGVGCFVCPLLRT